MAATIGRTAAGRAVRVSVDAERLVLTRGREVLIVPPFQFRMALYLSLHPGFVRSRAQIIEQLQSYGDRDGDLRSIDTLVQNLRRALRKKWGAEAEACIQTRRGFGYFWKEASDGTQGSA